MTRAQRTGGGPALHEPTAEQARRFASAGQPEEVTVRGRIGEDQAAAVLRLADAAAERDGVGPLSEDVRLHLRYGGDGAALNLLLYRDAGLAGFAHLGPPDPGGERSGELAVHPSHRGHGLGLTLVRALVAMAGAQPMRIWAHGDLPAAARLANAAGFTRARALWQMQGRTGAPLGEPSVAGGISLRTFVPGQDETAWLRLNALAFAGHPEQARWTHDDLDRREREPWFDPGGFFLAQRGGRLVGFHWTKVHGGGAGNRPTGEVYVVGVDPAERGSGLGRALVIVGLRYLDRRGIGDVMLYVDESNTAAIRLYESLGFTHTGTDVMYRRVPGP